MEATFKKKVILFLLKDCMHNRDCERLAVLAKLVLVKTKISHLGQTTTNLIILLTIVHVSSSENDWNLFQQGYWKVLCTHSLVLIQFQDKTMIETWKKNT